jgi:hypothetical protein
MMSVIALALVDSLAKYVFTKTLNSMDKIDIGGAPSWYMKEVDDKMCTFTHSKGGLDSVQIAKDKSIIKMTKTIDDMIDIVIYDNTKKITNLKEKKLVELWNEDPHLNKFVKKNLQYSKVVYEDEIDTTFVRACIPNDTVINYQKQRLEGIKKSLVNYKRDSAIDEMEESLKEQ